MMEPKVIFEDEQLLVLGKPAGMIVNRADTTKGETTIQDWIESNLKISNLPSARAQGEGKSQISNKSQIQNPNNQNGFEFRNSDFEFLNRAGIVHRLDKETSGILLVAKTPEAYVELQRQFKERIVKKTYLALVHGDVTPEEGVINVPVGRLPWNRKQFGVIAGGRESVTRYRAIFNFHPAFGGSIFNEQMTLLELYPETGRTHQIRVHLKHIGHPIFSDPLYGGRKQARNDRKVLGRVFLHAAKISFLYPSTQKEISFESPLPEELQKVLDS